MGLGDERRVLVAVPRAVDQLFTYRVPQAMHDIEPGTRVLVSFGRQRLTGIVVEADAPELPGHALRDVELVLDERPTLSAPLIALARFVAEHYICPLGEVLRAMHAGGPRGVLVAGITPEGRLALAGAAKGVRQRRVLEALAARDELAVTALSRQAGLRGGAGLRELVEHGWIAVRERVEAPAGARQVRVYVLAASSSEEGDPVVRSATRREVLDALAQAPEGLTAAELALALGRGTPLVRAAADALVGRGVVRVESRRELRSPPALAPLERADVVLTHEQQRVLDDVSAAIDASSFAVFLVEGVTGSGKTEVYLRALAHAISLGRTGIYLVPEISITPLLMRLVRARFGSRTAILHSGLSQGERHDERSRIVAGEVDVVLGARSAVFAPMPRLGLVVVDEEHDSSYKQDSRPRYHGRDVAVMRGHIEGVPLLLGSATPSLESHHNALSNKYQLRHLSRRAGGAEPSRVELVDMRLEWKASRSSQPLSRRLREALDATLAAGQQAMLLLNRRGWADFVLCRQCGEPERCDRCSVTLTVHRRLGRLLCHYCGLWREIPERCRHCDGNFLQQVGQGTEQLEETLVGQLPDVPIARLDRDVARRRGAVAEVLADFEAGKTRILLGTQLIAKGHDFPGVTLVGVLQADRQLWLPDFRAAERTFQLLTQVAGRAGRRREPGLVVVQTHAPDHPALQAAARQDYAAFYEAEAGARQALAYPPFAFLVSLLVSGEDAAAAEAQARALAAALSGAQGCRILGPAPAPIARIEDRWRFQLLVKSRDRRAAGAAVREAVRAAPSPESISVEIDVDPQSLL